MTITETATVLTRSPTPLTATVDDEVVMLEPSTSRYFGLEKSGARIWELLDSPRSVAEIVELLLLEYEVDRETCTADVLGFVSSLVDAGLVTATQPG